MQGHDVVKNKFTGITNKNNFGSLMSIYEYRSRGDIDVIFLDNNHVVYNKRYKDFLCGKTKSPYEKRTYGVGYIGEGIYKQRLDGVKTKVYNVWKGCIERCYSEIYHAKHPTYKGCTVCEEWYNFQTFAKWYDENYYEIEGQQMHLDKDILCKGNKIYSPETCVFVPNSINLLFTKTDAKRGSYPIGVSYNKKKDTYTSNCSSEFNKRYLGSFKTVGEAFDTYKIEKEKTIKSMANKYKENIPKNLYLAMHNYIVEITD